ncbi:MAG: transposase, partial [Methylococcales bacterium]|nr:transposase [Methylococcales bacterium]
AEVRPGKQSAGKHSMAGLWKIIDSLPAPCRPRLIRGDVSYGNENIMVEAQKRDQAYLFKLKQTSKVKKELLDLERDGSAWSDAGDGWQGAESHLKLTGWSCSRRCVFIRRPSKKEASPNKLLPAAGAEFDFVEHLDSGPNYDYVVLITNNSLPIIALAQLYRDRADCENVFDEIKNQWGWAGFVTHDLQRCRIMARLIALIYNWWNIFTRLAQPNQHMEAITSRPLLLYAVGRLASSGRKKTLHLTSTHALAEKVQSVLTQIGSFLNTLRRTAEQLSVEARWAMILSVAFVKWLRGKVLHPVTDGEQILLQLLA